VPVGYRRDRIVHVVITECSVEDYDEMKEIPVTFEEVSQVIDDSN